MLKGIKPVAKEKRLKLFLFGPAGIGKTLAALQFPNAYIIDTEKGTDFYSETINKQSSVVLQTLNPEEVKDEIKKLLVEKHNYKTLIIDPITQVYNAVQEKWTRVFEKYAKDSKGNELQDFGMRYWNKVKGEFKSIQRAILSLDMNVIITSHQKDVYGANFSKIGVTFDSMKNDDYLFDLVFRLEKRSNNKRMAIKEKERADLNKEKFPHEFEWSYENFCKYYGKEIIEKNSLPIELASTKDIEKITNMVNTLKIDDEIIGKWFTKAGVDSFEEMSKEQIVKAIDFCETKIKNLRNENKK